MGAITPLKKQPATSVWLSPEDVVSRVPGMTLDKLEDLRKRREGPAYYKPTLRTVVYLEAEVDAWVAASRVKTTGGA
jgi:hypothetical protein